MSIFDEPSKQPLPSEPTLEDYRLALIKGGLSALPLVGGALAEAMGLLLITPLARRRDGFWEDLARRVLYLESRVEGFKFENLRDNDEFVSAMIQATQSATKTHLKEKLEALRNAVLNVALGKAPSPDRQQQFPMLVDRFSETHLAILKFLNDPAFSLSGAHPLAVAQVNHVKAKLMINTLIGEALPPLRKASDDPTATSFQFVEVVLGDLVAAHLVRFERHQETWVVPAFAIKAGGGLGKMTTHLGEEFLAFIAETDFRTCAGPRRSTLR